MAKFRIYKTTNGEYYFNLLASNNEVIITSESYTSKASCRNGVDAVKTNSINDNAFQRITAKNGKFYFHLKATNGQVLATSKQYTTETARDTSIYAVKTSASTAVLDATT